MSHLGQRPDKGVWRHRTANDVRLCPRSGPGSTARKARHADNRSLRMRSVATSPSGCQS
jgi:hypothetical protein